MDKFKVVNVKNLVSKEKGTPFCVLQLKNTRTGEVGDYVIFGSDSFNVDDVVSFQMSLNYRYQWVATLVRC